MGLRVSKLRNWKLCGVSDDERVIGDKEFLICICFGWGGDSILDLLKGYFREIFSTIVKSFEMEIVYYVMK